MAFARQAMQQDRLGEDAADRVPRIKRGHRVLKDHLHATAQRSARFVKRGDIAAVEDDRARDRLAAWAGQVDTSGGWR